MASVMPVAPSTNINSRAVGFHMSANGTVIEKSGGKYAEEWLPVRRALHGDKGKIAAYMAGEVDPRITSSKLMTKIRNASLMPARLANLPIMQAGLLVKILTMNFCMVIDWIGAGNKTPDAAHERHLCMFYPAPASSTQSASIYHEFRTSLEIKDAIENFRLILMDMFQERIGSKDPFFAEIFEMMKSQLLDEGPDSIHHVNIDYQVRSVEAQLVEFARLYTNGDNEHMDFEEFKRLNKKILRIDTSKWLDDHSRLDRTKIPRQVVAPPGVKPTQPLKRDFHQAFNDDKNERPHKRGLWNPRGDRGGGNGGRGRGRDGGRGRYGGFKREIPEEDPLVGANKIQARIKAPIKGVCIRDTVHAKDPVKFPVGCTKPDCQHRHDVILMGAGKLSPPDKEAVVKTLTHMPGNFAKGALVFINQYM